MSISKDETFREFLDIYGQNYYFDEGFDDSLSRMYKEKCMQCRKKLIDYIDKYVTLQIHLEEFPSGISFEEGLEKLPEWQKELNQRVAKSLQIINDNEEKK